MARSARVENMPPSSASATAAIKVATDNATIDLPDMVVHRAGRGACLPISSARSSPQGGSLEGYVEATGMTIETDASRI